MATVQSDQLLEDAALVVDECFSVEEGDVVTIICDDDREDEARAVAEVCVERGAWPVIMNNETQVRRGRADVRFPMAPPENLHRAMVGSDEVIIIANLEWANRFAHVNAVRETCEANGKIASIEPGMGEWGLTREDLERSAQRTKDAVAALEGKTQCHVTTALGTDFYVSIEGRPPLCLTPYKARGQMMSPVPLWTEVAFAAIEDFTHGTAVVDGVMLGIGLDGTGEGADQMDARGRQVRGDRGRGGGGAPAQGDRRRGKRHGDRRVRVRDEREGALRDPVREGPDRDRPPGSRRQPQCVSRRAEPLRAPPRRCVPERDAPDRRRRHLHPERRGVGAVVRVVALDDADPIELPQGSWSRMLVTAGRVEGNASSLGYSVFTPGTVLTPVKHETEEVAYTVSGSGELRLDDGAVSFTKGDAIHIPAGVWHAVANTGDQDLVMVFGFPYPEFPPTERRE